MTTKAKQKFKDIQAVHQFDSLKRRLMQLANELMNSRGMTTKGKQLDKLIARMEKWQH